MPTTRQEIQWLDGVVVVRFERGAYFYMFGTDDATPSADCTKLNIPLPTCPPRTYRRPNLADRDKYRIHLHDRRCTPEAQSPVIVQYQP
jgi:hypothetical protein